MCFTNEIANCLSHGYFIIRKHNYVCITLCESESCIELILSRLSRMQFFVLANPLFRVK